MVTNSRKLKGHIALSLLIIVCLIMASAMTFFAIDKNVESAALTSGAPSVLNLNASGGLKDNFSGVITGAQNEYIYFGSNSNNAIKWRILSTTDNNYNTNIGSKKSWLLWADSNIGTSQFSSYYETTYHAYWGTSYIRALLNGGDYLGSYTNVNTMPAYGGSFTISDSYYSTKFNDYERDSIVKTTDYQTKDFAVDNSATPQFRTVDITGTGFWQYNTDQVTAMNNITSTATIQVSANQEILETTSDYIFILDYYDLNNTDFGFGDNGVVYANKVNSNWQPTDNGYPSVADNSATATYLAEGASYWVRAAARYGYTNGNQRYSGAMNITETGTASYPNAARSHGVRPAFNFSPSNVIYATAASVGSNGAMLTKVDNPIAGKPAYKVYMKTSAYKNYNDSANSAGAPTMAVSGNKVSVTKSGQTGSAIILLAAKSGNGAVSYQATAAFNGGVATATLPSGVKISDYTLTVLFADTTDGVNGVRGGNYAESISGSYTTTVLPMPKDIDPVDYNGQVQTLDTLKTSLDWYEDIFEDTSVINVEYLDSTGNTVLTSGAGNLPKDAGNYKIRFTIQDKDHYQWPDKNTDSKLYRTIDLEIKQIEIAYPTIKGSSSKKYDGGKDVRFELSGFDPDYMEIGWKDNYTGVKINTTSSVHSVSANAVGDYELEATIKSAQAINYKFSSKPKLEVHVTPAPLVIEKIVVHGSGNNSNFSISEGATSISADIFVDNVKGAPLGSDVVPIVIYSPEYNKDLSQVINLDATALPGTAYQVTNQQIINIEEFFEGSYTLDVKTTDKNYEISLTNAATLIVLPQGQITNIRWKLLEDGIENT